MAAVAHVTESATLFIHSTATSASMWSTQPERMGSARLTPTNVGMPPRPPLAAGAKFTAHDEAMGHLPLLAQFRDVHLVAHSYGASVAMQLVPLIRNKVRSIFLFEPVIYAALPPDLRNFEPKWFTSPDDPRVGTDAWLEHFVDYWNRPGSWARLPDDAKAFMRAASAKMVQEVFSCFNEVAGVDPQAFPQVSTTLVTAERSPPAARAMLQLLGDAYPWAKVVDLKNTGHMAPLTHPHLVHEALAEHWART